MLANELNNVYLLRSSFVFQTKLRAGLKHETVEVCFVIGLQSFVIAKLGVTRLICCLRLPLAK